MPEFINSCEKGNFTPRPDFRPLTKFEKRGITHGHGVWDLIYLKPKKVGQSNDINQAAKFWLLYADDCGGIGVRYCICFIQ